MKRMGNTLYITTQGSYLSKEGNCLLASRDDGGKTRVPLHNVDGIVCFGRVSVSPFLLGHCAENGVTVSWLTERGRFLARPRGRFPVTSAYGGRNTQPPMIPLAAPVSRAAWWRENSPTSATF